MRKLVLKMSMSIDGFVGGPNGELDWLFESMTESNKSWIRNTLANAEVHIMGSRTFYDMKAYWPYSDDQLAAPMNNIPKVVFTKKGIATKGETTAAIAGATTADKAKGITLSGETSRLDSWLNATIASGDLAEEIVRLKEQPGGSILAHGGAGFAQSLIKTGLIDEYHLLVHPAMLGAGLPIFSGLPQPVHVQLFSSTLLDAGVVANIYHKA
jgi:dihydrofolate reductase